MQPFCCEWWLHPRSGRYLVTLPPPKRRGVAFRFVAPRLVDADKCGSLRAPIDATPRFFSARGYPRRSPPQNDLFSLKRPIIWMLNQTVAYWVRANINPLGLVRGCAQKLSVPKAPLPDGPIARSRPTAGDITFPFGDPVRQRRERNIVLSREQMHVFRHNHIATNRIIVVKIPGSPQEIVHFIAGEDWFSVLCTNG
jgi:hypothetical protein